MTIKTKFAVAGHYTIRKYSAGGILIQELEFTNLITDAGLNMLGNDATWCGNSSTLFGACYVGTGSTAPAVGDTALAACLPPARRGPRFVYRFDQGVGTGNLSELGTGTSSTNLFSRALIRDPITGNPVTITKLPDEFMDVTFELRVYVSASDTTGTVTISGVTYDTVTRICDINSPNMWAVDFRMTTRGIVAAGPSYFVGAQANQCAVYAGTLGAVTGRPSGANHCPHHACGLCHRIVRAQGDLHPGPVRWQRSWRHQVDCLSQRAWVLADAVHAGHSEDRGKCGPRTRYRPGDACRDPRFRLFIQRDRCRLALSDAGPIQAAGELHARHHGAGLPVLGGGGYLWSQAEGGQPVQELPLPGATRISACYDQNGRLHVVYNTAASCFFRWYDSQAGGMVTTEYAGVLDAQCILDDPRQYWSASSDVLLIYTLAGALNVREQRDRFGVVRVSQPAPGLKVIAAGMNDANRLQVECIPVA
ncbi:hypothetical protein SNK04_014046 [Fusarium graminearum]